MPTVLDIDGFHLSIFPPPREHGPPHVHVRRAGVGVAIDLPRAGRPVTVRAVQGMRNVDVVHAVRIVEDHVELLLRHWRRYHG